MPRFFLHLCSGPEFIEDDEGLELLDAAAARTSAISGLRDVLAGDLQHGHLNSASHILIEDERRARIGVVSFEDVVVISHVAASRPR